MVSNLMEAVKGTSSSKASQAQKNKKTASDEKSAFGQALTDAAGAANSANAQAERQTYEQKDTSATEKGSENVQAAQDTSEQLTMLGQEGVEGQNTLTSLMQMGAEGTQTAEDASALWGQNVAEAVQSTKAESVTDVMSDRTGAGAIKDLPQELSAEGDISLNPEELLKKAAVMEGQSEAKGQQSASDMGEKAAEAGLTEDESNVVDVNAEAAADKAGMSFMQLQGNSGSGVTEAQVEVTPTGEIKPEYANMLKDMIAKQISNGRQEFEISLTPRNLGALLIKVAVEAGETTVSIICSNAKTMEAMSSKAGELGKMLETTLGDKMEVVVEDKNGQESHFYEEGRNDSGAQAQKEEQERRHEENRRRMELEADSADFLQQLRLGLA